MTTDSARRHRVPPQGGLVRKILFPPDCIGPHARACYAAMQVSLYPDLFRGPSERPVKPAPLAPETAAALLAENGGNVTRAAQAANVARTTFRDALRRGGYSA